MDSLQFQPVNLEIHASTCLEFERDMERISSGQEKSAEDAQRGARFLEKIAAKLADEPHSCLHVWRENTIVGQLHLGRFFEEPVGYIHFLYLAPDYRGQGWAPLLDDYACQHFAKRGFRSARLSVDASNQRARQFYHRQNWREIGVRPDNPTRLMMEKAVI